MRAVGGEEKRDTGATGGFLHGRAVGGEERRYTETMVLERIDGPQDIKGCTDEELNILAGEIRDFLVQKTSCTGGHLASNLGVVELTMALYLAFDFPRDKVIWDVGHQSYTHKILSGRKDAFDELRQFRGISGFPKRRESPFDAFDTGHSSTSISAGLGMAQGRDVRGEDYHVVSVIGDGALTGGMAYEALNNAARLNTNFIIVLNDNNMSISENVGGMNKYLNSIRTATVYNAVKNAVQAVLEKIPFVGVRLLKLLRTTKSSIKQLLIPGMLFENMGITYLGPIDGHDIKRLRKTLAAAKRVPRAVLVHVMTRKGKGYAPAEEDPAKFHGVDPFDPETGLPKTPKANPSYTKVFSDKLCALAKEDPSIAAVTAAMPDGTGLAAFAKAFPGRFFDVGIAEAHGVTSAAGMAAAGLRPVVAIYSSFLQRGFDQVIHDVCIQNLPVVFAIDRAGLVGSDGETHQGIFDISYLSALPNMTVMAPKNRWELERMLEFALSYTAPIAVRYPRGESYQGLETFDAPIELGKGEVIYRESGVALLALGSMVSTAEHVREKLKTAGVRVSLANMRFAKPWDAGLVDSLAADHDMFVTMEENVLQGGMGLAITAYIHQYHPEKRVVNVGLPDSYVEHGDVSVLRSALGIDSDSIVDKLLPVIMGGAANQNRACQ